MGTVNAIDNHGVPFGPTPTEISAKACSGGLRPPAGCGNQSKHGVHSPPIQPKRLYGSAANRKSELGMAGAARGSA